MDHLPHHPPRSFSSDSHVYPDPIGRRYAPPTYQAPDTQGGKSSLDITQRLERKLAEFNSSQNILKRWLFEVISWIVSALCISAIIGILLYIDDKEESTIWPLSLTTIAILSKVASAALILLSSEAIGQLKWNWFCGKSKEMWDFEIFDKASRGPWGALMLLFRTRGRSLAALGAILTLLLLATDTFFQQVVNSRTLWTLAGTSSKIPKVTRYEPEEALETRGGLETSQQDQELIVIAKRFFYGNGTQPVPFNNGTRPDIPLACPTSNCTWPVYESLSVCSACTELPPRWLTFSCLSTRVDWTSNLTGFGTENTYPNRTMCGYFLNGTNPPILMSGYLANPIADTVGQASQGEALLMRTMPLLSNPDREPLFGGSINFKHIRNPITDVLIVSATNGSNSVYRNETPVAQECVLTWCVKSMKSSYDGARYKEEVLETIINTTTGPFPWLSNRIVTEYGENATEVSYLQNITIDAPTNDHNLSTYGVSNATHYKTVTIFDDIFPSFWTVPNRTGPPVLRYKFTISDGPPFLRTLKFNPWMPPNNLTRHMERLALAMTNVIRSSSSTGDVEGSAFNVETYVSVRWEWLTFPLTLLVLSLIFLVSTMVKTSKGTDEVGLWKTSAIPTLIYSLPNHMQEQFTSSTSWTSSSKEKKLKIKLLPKKGWRVSGQACSPDTPIIRRDRAPPGWI